MRDEEAGRGCFVRDMCCQGVAEGVFRLVKEALCVADMRTVVLALVGDEMVFDWASACCDRV